MKRMNLFFLIFQISYCRELIIDDFLGTKLVEKWRVTNDGVMGGKSQGSFKIDSGMMKFSGYLSLANYGGFSSLRGDLKTSEGLKSLNLENYSGIKLRVLGDGRTYKLSLNSDAVFSPRYPRPVSFRSEFSTTRGQWREVFISFSSLEASFRGLSMERTFNPSIVKSVGILLADKIEGPFEISVQWIKAV